MKWSAEKRISEAAEEIRDVQEGRGFSRAHADVCLYLAVESVEELPPGDRRTTATKKLNDLIDLAFPTLREDAEIVGSEDNKHARKALRFASTTTRWVLREEGKLRALLDNDREARRLISLTARREAERLTDGRWVSDHPLYSEQMKKDLLRIRRRQIPQPRELPGGLPGLGRRR